MRNYVYEKRQVLLISDLSIYKPDLVNKDGISVFLELSLNIHNMCTNTVFKKCNMMSNIKI